MSVSAQSIIDFGIQTAVQNSTFRPEMFLVAAGSYASDNSYGSDRPAITTYTLATDRSMSYAAIRNQDTETDYTIHFTLSDAAQPASVAAAPANSEVRLRVVKPLLPGQSGSYIKSLTCNAIMYSLPLFQDVEIVLASTGAPPAGFPSVAGAGMLEARYLYSGELALVVYDYSTAPPTVTPLTRADFSPLFTAGGDSIIIRIRGRYRNDA